MNFPLRKYIIWFITLFLFFTFIFLYFSTQSFLILIQLSKEENLVYFEKIFYFYQPIYFSCKLFAYIRLP